MDKRTENNCVVYSKSRHILLLLLLPLPALLTLKRVLDMDYGWLPIVVTSLFAIAGLGLALTREKLVLDYATRLGSYDATLAGIFKTRVAFSFKDVVGVHFMQTIPDDTDNGRRVPGSQVLFYVYLLYRDASGKLADQIELGVYSNKEDAMKEADEITRRVGGKFYRSEDLPID